MKKQIFVLFLALVGFQSAHAATQSLVCTSGNDFERFGATLDDSSFDAGSGLFRVEKAWINDNYANAQLLCTGYRLGEITCVGFWFNQGSRIVKVTVRNQDGVFKAVHTELEGGPIYNTSPWPCTVQ
jgi:hypothetical protein